MKRTRLTDNRFFFPGTDWRIPMAGMIIILATAWFSTGYNHFDEHCQVIEFAGYKLGLTDLASLPWEYASEIRPSFQPVLVIGIIRLSWLFGITDPFTIAFFTRLFAGLVSLLGILMILKVYLDTFENQKLKNILVLLSFFLWFSVYNSVRFSSETMSGRIFVIGLALFLLRENKGRHVYLLTGLLMGLAFLFRFQVALMIVGYFLWLVFIRRSGFKPMGLFTLGLVLPVLAGTLSDRWFYGHWVITPYNYFTENLVAGRAATFGVSPWYYYITETFMNAIPPFSLVFIAAVFLWILFRPKDPVTWSVVPFLLAHFIIGHKEIRFMFPIIGFIPVMIVFGADMLTKRFGHAFTGRPWARWPVRLFWITNAVMTAVLIFRPADSQISLYQTLYDRYTGPARLYYRDENPYLRAKVLLNYYKRPGLDLLPYDTSQPLPWSADTTLLVVTSKPQVPSSEGFTAVPVYASFPSWVRKFNVNHWIERTDFWYVYEMKPNQIRR